MDIICPIGESITCVDEDPLKFILVIENAGVAAKYDTIQLKYKDSSDLVLPPNQRKTNT